MAAGKTNARETIYHTLMQDIMHGRLRSGERLLEVELTERFNCSRTPVREAIRQLQSDGYIAVVSNKGATVSTLSIKDVKEIYAVRSLLETYAVELACGRMNKGDSETLVQLQNRLELHLAKKDHQRYLKEDLEFHLFFPTLTGNHQLRQLIYDLRMKLNVYQYVITAVLGNSDLWISGHRRIIEAILAGKAKAAAQSMRRHLEDSRNVAIQVDSLQRGN